MICAILFIWIVMPAYITTVAHLSTDIVRDTCVPWFGASSYALVRAVSSLNVVVTYLIPLTCVVICYSRIVYMLRNKVTFITMNCNLGLSILSVLRDQKQNNGVYQK